MIYWSDLTPIRHISDLQTLQHLEQINACNCNRHLILQEVDPTGPLVLLYNPSVASVHRRLSINTAHCYGCRRDAWCFHLSHLLQLCTDVESEMFTADKHEANNSDKIICYRLTVVDVRHSVYTVFGCLHVSGFENDPSVCFDCMHCCMLCFPFFFFLQAYVQVWHLLCQLPRTIRQNRLENSQSTICSFCWKQRRIEEPQSASQKGGKVWQDQQLAQKTDGRQLGLTGQNW